jgi:hypothetical protein
MHSCTAIDTVVSVNIKLTQGKIQDQNKSNKDDRTIIITAHKAGTPPRYKKGKTITVQNRYCTVHKLGQEQAQSSKGLQEAYLLQKINTSSVHKTALKLALFLKDEKHLRHVLNRV